MDAGWADRACVRGQARERSCDFVESCTGTGTGERCYDLPPPALTQTMPLQRVRDGCNIMGRKKTTVAPSDATARSKRDRSFSSRLCTGDANPLLNLLCCPVVGLYQSTKIYVLPCIGIYLRSLLFNVLCGVCWPYLRGCCTFTDNKFKHDHSSLGKWQEQEGPVLDDKVKWERANDFYTSRLTPEQKKKGVRVKLFEKGIEPKDVAQGQVGNCWLIAALACVAEHPGLVRKSFVTKVRSVRGKYTCRLFDWQKRKWVTVQVDEFIPLTASDRQMLFAQPNGHELVRHQLLSIPPDDPPSPNACCPPCVAALLAHPAFGVDQPRCAQWVSMLEKAFAKFCGGYGTLDGGQTGWALNALTGDPVFKLKKSGEGEATAWKRLDMRIEPDPTNKRACAFYSTDEAHDNLHTFFLIRQYCKRAALLGASFGAYKPEEKGEGLNGESMGPQGLVAGHAYSILDAMSFADKAQPGGRLKLIQLRNPWGRYEWTGAWSDGAKEWAAHPTVKRICSPAKADDGSFWMSWEDFSDVFQSIDVCARSTGLRDLNLDAMESDGRCKNAIGPLLGCLKGCACFWFGCKGCKALYFDVKADERTLVVDDAKARDDDLLGNFISSAAEVASVMACGKQDEDHAEASGRPGGGALAAGEAAAAGSAPPPGMGATAAGGDDATPSPSMPTADAPTQAADSKAVDGVEVKPAALAYLAHEQPSSQASALEEPPPPPPQMTDPPQTTFDEPPPPPPPPPMARPMAPARMTVSRLPPIPRPAEMPTALLKPNAGIGGGRLPAPMPVAWQPRAPLPAVSS